jgi:hypothetical protein
MTEKQGFVRWFLTGYVKIAAVAVVLTVVGMIFEYLMDPPDKELAQSWSVANADLIAAEEARLTALQGDIMVLLEQGNTSAARVRLTALRWDINLNNPHRGPGTDVHEQKWNRIRSDLDSAMRSLEREREKSTAVVTAPAEPAGGATGAEGPEQPAAQTGINCDGAQEILLAASTTEELQSAKALVAATCSE